MTENVRVQATLDELTYDYTFTVFTPTFNRDRTLHRVYESLKAQTFRAFEWLIVDDGSTDATAELIQQWKSLATFPIRYYYQPNSGKPVAINKAVSLARGQFFLIADSDDAFLPTTLQQFLFHWNSIPEGQREFFSGVTCLCQDENGKRVGMKYPFDPTDSNLLEIHYRYRVRQEQWIMCRTDIMKEFPFPEVPGEKYVLEGVVWFKIAREYRSRFVNEMLRIYCQGEDNQISRNPINSHMLTTVYYLHLMNKDLDWFLYAPFSFWRGAVVYAHFSFVIKNPWIAQWRGLTNWKARLLWLTGVVPGYFLAKRDIWRTGTEIALSDRPVVEAAERRSQGASNETCD